MKQTRHSNFTLIAKAKETIEEQIKRRGYHIVVYITLLETSVKFEFNLEKNVSQFNIRERMINLLEKMKRVDTTLRIRSTVDIAAEWDKPELLPEDADFSKYFTVKDLSFRRSRKVFSHMILLTKLPINRIKYTLEV